MDELGDVKVEAGILISSWVQGTSNSTKLVLLILLCCYKKNTKFASTSSKKNGSAVILYATLSKGKSQTKIFLTHFAK